MTPVCALCEGEITAGNRAWPGFCSPTCRDTHRQQHARIRDVCRKPVQPEWAVRR